MEEKIKMRNLSIEIFSRTRDWVSLTQRSHIESLGAVVTAPASGTRGSGWRARCLRPILSDHCLSGDELGEEGQLRDFEAEWSGHR